MVDYNNTIKDLRGNLRVKENRPISWDVENNNVKGVGRVRNISLSGMLMETNSDFEPKQDAVFSFRVEPGNIECVPQRGRLVWCRKRKLLGNRHLCGIEFMNPTDDIMAKLRQEVQTKIIKLTKIRQIKVILNAVVLIALIALTALLLWNSSLVYNDVSSSHKSLIAVSNDQAVLTRTFYKKLNKVQERLLVTDKVYKENKAILSSVREDLEATKIALNETQTMLSQTQADNSRLTTELVSLRAESEQKRIEFENTINLLNEKNTRLSNEMDMLQAKLRYLSGEVEDITAARSLISFYQNKAKIVSAKIRAFKKEAYDAKVAAFAERDRVRSAIGNNGYFVKEGKPVVVDMQKYNEAKDAQLQNKITSSERKVDIDVRFVD